MNECKCIFWYIQVKTVTEISKISGTWKQQSRIVLRDQREISMTLCWIIDAPILNLVLREEETSFSISKFTHAINSKSNHLVKNTWKLFFFLLYNAHTFGGGIHKRRHQSGDGGSWYKISKNLITSTCFVNDTFSTTVIGGSPQQELFFVFFFFLVSLKFHWKVTRVFALFQCSSSWIEGKFSIYR